MEDHVFPSQMACTVPLQDGGIQLHDLSCSSWKDGLAQGVHNLHQQ